MPGSFHGHRCESTNFGRLLKSRNGDIAVAEAEAGQYRTQREQRVLYLLLTHFWLAAGSILFELVVNQSGQRDRHLNVVTAWDGTMAQAVEQGHVEATRCHADRSGRRVLDVKVIWAHSWNAVGSGTHHHMARPYSGRSPGDSLAE